MVKINGTVGKQIIKANETGQIFLPNTSSGQIHKVIELLQTYCKLSDADISTALGGINLPKGSLEERWGGKKAKAKGGYSGPKKPLSAYNWYVKEAVVPTGENRMKLVASMWAILTDEDKEVYEQKARDDKLRYQAELADAGESSGSSTESSTGSSTESVKASAPKRRIARKTVKLELIDTEKLVDDYVSSVPPTVPVPGTVETFNAPPVVPFNSIKPSDELTDQEPNNDDDDAMLIETEPEEDSSENEEPEKDNEPEPEKDSEPEPEKDSEPEPEKDSEPEPEKDSEVVPEKDSEVESIAFSNIPATIEGDEFCDMLS
jgi:hypothetical protein